jgi:hypothetical protein
VDPYTAAEEIVRQAVNTTSPPADTFSS